MALANRGVHMHVLESLLQESKRILKFDLSLPCVDGQDTAPDSTSRASDVVRAAAISAQLDLATIAATSDADCDCTSAQRFHILVLLERSDRSSSSDDAYATLRAALMLHASDQARSPLRTG